MILFCIPYIFHQIGSCEEDTGSLYYVSSSGESNFSTIQEGIDAALPGDIIIVHSGIYYENIVIDKSISLISENKNNTIIDGRKAGNVIKINADNVTIKGFTIQHSGIYFPNAGINCSSHYNIIENNIILNNNYGITLYNSADNKIIDNIIQDNTHCGIYMSNSSNNLILNNIIKDHTYNGIGIYDNSDNNLIKNNSLTDNNYCGVNIRISSQNTVIGNIISDNNIGIHIPQFENIISANNFSNNNVNIDKEIITPGFELLIFILSIVLIISYYVKQKKRI
jgi:parallel beta-helix repeat protein